MHDNKKGQPIKEKRDRTNMREQMKKNEREKIKEIKQKKKIEFKRTKYHLVNLQQICFIIIQC